MPSISGIIKSVSIRSNLWLRNSSSAALAEAKPVVTYPWSLSVSQSAFICAASSSTIRIRAKSWSGMTVVSAWSAI